MIEYRQEKSTISTSRARLWMCNRGDIQTVLTWLHTQHEDGTKVTQANAFLATFPKQDVLLEELHKEGDNDN